MGKQISLLSSWGTSTPDPGQQMAPDKAATIIVAYFRGWKVRQNVVLPKQILPVLKEFLIKDPKEKLQDTARVLCRKIHAISQMAKGKGFHFDKMQKEIFPVFEGKEYKNSREIISSLDLWGELSKDGKQINLLNIFSSLRPLGEGTFRIVYRSKYIQIPLKLKENVRAVESQPQGSIRANLSKDGLLSSREELLKEALEIHRVIFNTIKNAKIVTVPIILSNSPLEMRQEWYNGDLEKALSVKKLPLKIDVPSPQKEMTFREILKILLDATESVRNFHSYQYIHGDIKPANILVKINEDNEVEGYLADFDFTGEISIQEKHKENSYAFWDLCMRKRGWKTPFCDYYGLVISLTRAVLCEISYLSVTSLSESELKRTLWRHADTFIDEKLKQPHLRFKLKLNEEMTRLKICEKIKNFTDTNELEAQHKKALEILKVELEMLETAFNLVRETLQTCSKVYEELKENGNLQLHLEKKGLAVAVDELSRKYPLADKFYSTLKTMYQRIDDAYRVYK